MSTFIPETTINQIKESADIVEIVSEVVSLKKTGKNFIGLCPFHTEKTPSFTVSPDKKIFHCFGCGTGGNALTFIMKQGNLSFPEAVQTLARRYGIEIPTRKMSPEQRQRLSERERLYSLNQSVADYYIQKLSEKNAGKIPRQYLKKRRIDPQIIERFGLGYAPSGWENLVRFLQNRKIPSSLAEKSGVIVAGKKQGYYDRFRNRIIFPIRDLDGKIIAFGGRVMDDSIPKYLNSPETPLYNKGRSLYGANLARNRCRETETVYIVEGYFDLIALHQGGIQNAVATLGTALTLDHVKILRGFLGKNGRAILIFDSDDAGIRAAMRSIEVFDQGFLDARILVLPSGYDPDDFLKQFGPDAFLKSAGEAMGIVSFLMESAVKRHGNSVEGKTRVLDALKIPISRIKDSVKRNLAIQAVSERIAVNESVVREAVRTFSGSDAQNATAASHGNKKPKSSLFDRGNRLERKILAMMLHFPASIPEIKREKVLERFENPILKEIGQTILNRTATEACTPESLLEHVPEEARPLISKLAFEEEEWSTQSAQKMIAAFMDANRKRREDDLLSRIRAAEADNDQELLKKLLSEKQRQAVQNQRRRATLFGGQ